MSAHMHIQPAVVQNLKTSPEHLFATKCYALASTVMLVYDTIITLDREIEFVWKSRLSGVKLLFFFNRYANIGAYIISWIAVNSAWPKDVCQRYVMFPGIFNLFQQVVVECILLLYGFALCNRSKRILLIVIAIFIAQIILIGWSLSAINAIVLPPPLAGCIYSGKPGTDRRVIAAWIMQLVFMAVGFSLMFWKALELRRDQVRTPLITFMTRDALKYSAVILAVNMVNVLNFSLVKSIDLRSLHVTFSALMTVIMINRLILTLREEGARTSLNRVTTSGASEVIGRVMHHVTFIEEHDPNMESDAQYI